MGDDIGWSNISVYNVGLMGYQTPNIDRLAREGLLFTDYYGQQRCKGGRHLVYPDHTPLTNLQLTLLGSLGVPTEKLGDSTGQLKELSGLSAPSR